MGPDHDEAKGQIEGFAAPRDSLPRGLKKPSSPLQGTFSRCAVM
jgi:hypothetical protein